MTRIKTLTQAVPLDAEDERLVDALVARKMAGVGTRPLRRKVTELLRKVLYVVGVCTVVILGTAILVWSAFFQPR